MAIYSVQKGTEPARLIKAKTKAAAILHVASPDIKATSLTTDQLHDAIEKGWKVEAVTAEEEKEAA